MIVCKGCENGQRGALYDNAMIKCKGVLKIYLFLFLCSMGAGM